MTTALFYCILLCATAVQESKTCLQPASTTTRQPVITTRETPESTTSKTPQSTTSKKPATSTTSRSSSTTTPVGRLCPRGWLGFRSHCFRFISDPVSWFEAEEHCNKLGGHLAAVTSHQEYIFLQRNTRKIGQSRMWLGGFNLQGRWMWTDRKGFYYSNWHRPLVLPHTNPCLYLYTNSGWSNTRCGFKFPFICSRNPFGC